MKNYSQIGQDLMVIDLIDSKKNGTFVDIGCASPIHINNTYLLENKLNWTGISIDIASVRSEWEKLRPDSKLIIADALKLNYSDIFEENNLPFNIDYLTLDLEPPEITFETLQKLPLDDYTFNVVTYEHDGYRTGEKFKEKTRDYLKSHDYILIQEINNQDDIYVHNNFTHNVKIGQKK